MSGIDQRVPPSQRLADRPIEMGHVLGGVPAGEVGVAADDRLDHRQVLGGVVDLRQPIEQ
jgi:hypothetical protein